MPPLDLLVPIVVLIIIFLLCYYRSSTKYEGYETDHPVIQAIKLKLMAINPEFTKIDMRVANESATMNKRTIFLCVYDENGKVYDMNTLIHVALHEIAHMLSDVKSVNHEHDDQFKGIFYDLLGKAQSAGIYDSSISVPKDYCKRRRVQ